LTWASQLISQLWDLYLQIWIHFVMINYIPIWSFCNNWMDNHILIMWLNRNLAIGKAIFWQRSPLFSK
jgi:hypothetical protein